MIHAQGLVQTFHTRQGRSRTEVRAVDGVDLDVAEGEVVGFLGPNGAGKTTTLRMLTTLLRPTAGTATVAGHDVVTESEAVRRSIGYVSQAAARSAAPARGTRSSTTACSTGCPTRRRGAGQGALRAHGPAGAVDADAAQHVRRAEAPPGHRHGAHPRAAADVPGRADHRPRPAGAGQPVGAHPRPARPARGHGLPHHALHGRGGRAGRPDRRHRPRPHRRLGHRRQPQGAGRRGPRRPRGRRPRPGHPRRREAGDAGRRRRSAVEVDDLHVRARVPRAGRSVQGLLRDLDGAGIDLQTLEIRRPTLDDVFLGAHRPLAARRRVRRRRDRRTGRHRRPAGGARHAGDGDRHPDRRRTGTSSTDTASSEGALR